MLKGLLEIKFEQAFFLVNNIKYQLKIVYNMIIPLNILVLEAFFVHKIIISILYLNKY